MAKRKKRKAATRTEQRKQILVPREKRLLVPSELIMRPLSPFERRMLDLDFAFRGPPQGSPEGVRLQRLMDMDIAFQLKLKELERRLPHVILARMKGGSGLQLANVLRWYFGEYLDRLFKHGPESFPTSFNVVESFLSFNQEYMFFDLRDELEHLISIDDYFRWYERGDGPKEPRILEGMMTEGQIYSYEMVSDAGGFRIAGDSTQVFAGVSFVRHKHELSCLLLAGENPPLHSDEEVLSRFHDVIPAPGRNEIVPHPTLTVRDRYLDGYPGFAKVIVLTRFDLRAAKHDVRYVNLDSGPSFVVLTDDSAVFEDLPPERVEECRQTAADGLKRYNDLFAGLASLIYLPAFIASHSEKMQDLVVATKLNATRDDKEVSETIAALGELQCVTQRRIRCLPVTLQVDDRQKRLIEPPPMEFKCDGYWKAIGPQQIGEDQNGNRIVGRTWVSRHESWSARSPQSFMLQRATAHPDGPDPGVIYIQRSPAHEVNVYKIGLTRRDSAARAKELSSATGVPLPFGVLGNWEVGDCASVEREVHRRLSAYRLNPRREFFLAELALINQTIDAVIRELTSE